MAASRQERIDIWDMLLDKVREQIRICDSDIAYCKSVNVPESGYAGNVAAKEQWVLALTMVTESKSREFCDHGTAS